MKGEGRALGKMPLTAWHTVGAQKRWLLPFGFCSSAPSPTPTSPGPQASITCQRGAARRPHLYRPLSAAPSPLHREARRPRAGWRAAPSAHDGDAAPVTPRAPAALFPSVQQGPSSQRLGYGLHATPGGCSAHVPGAAGRDGKRKHGPRRAALGPGGAAGSAAAAAAATAAGAARTSSSRALRR